jgi:predicted SAM-dependent methyltransferase
MKLNLGCGKKILQGYDNIDLNNKCKNVIDCDIRYLQQYANESIEEIILHNVLEHLANKDLRPALKEWNRILKINGIINIHVPNVIGAVKAFLNNKLITIGFARHYKNWSAEEVLFQMLYGRADILGDNDPIECQHMTGFSYNRLNRFLKECGFEIIKYNDNTDTDQNLEIIAKKII